MNDPARTVLTPEELAARYAVAKSTVLEWFHQGKIPAEVAMGKVIRFCPVRVAKALAREAPKARRGGTAGEGVMVI